MSDTIPGTTGPHRQELFYEPVSGLPVASGEEGAVLRQTLAALPLKGTVTLCIRNGSLVIAPGKASSLEEHLLDED